MEFWGDYHTHSPYSHGKSPIAENVKSAEKRGLKEIAITDHGFSHALYAVKRDDLDKMRSEIDKCDSKVKVYLGIEANLMSYDGDIDIRLDEINNIDLLIVGYHRFISGGFWRFSCPNLVSVYTRIGKKKQSVRNTEAICKAIERYPIDIISHPAADFPIDISEVAQACAYFGTFLELNRKRILSDDDVTKILKTDAMFIASSDAHSADKVGDFAKAESLIDRVGVPRERVANLQKPPSFRSGRILRR